ncbi:MAG: GDP-mannose 4,6-dehydratase [Anaerolineae bacterium]|nr:GDP-mannose 4,6-dehydratase [Anaerolineae bacterium]
MGNYLVTGAAGFIGWKVCEFLLAENHTVLGLDNLNDAYDVRLKEWRLQQLKDRAGFEFHRLDITDRPALTHSALKGQRFDAVINLAARAGVRQSVENPWVYFETNVTGTLNLLELCRESGIQKFILASTSSLYGANNPMPWREDQNTNRPLSPYAASKKAAEALCYSYHYLYNLDVTVFRYFTVYGPAGRPDMSLFRFVQWISREQPVLVFGDGQQFRDFTYVDDIARGTLAGLKPVGYEIINLGSDEPIVLKEAIALIETAVGKKARLEYTPRHPADITKSWADISKAKQLLDWQPQSSFRQGISELVAWYRNNEAWAKTIKTH